MPVLTAYTITDDQIRELRASVLSDGHPWDAQGYGPSDIAADCAKALQNLGIGYAPKHERAAAEREQRAARARCAEAINARTRATSPA